MPEKFKNSFPLWQKNFKIPLNWKTGDELQSPKAQKRKFKLCSHKFWYQLKFISLQLTEDGVNGVTGQNALLNVEEEIRRENGPALILLQLTVVQTVWEMLRKHKPATKIPAPVRVEIHLNCCYISILFNAKQSSYDTP